MKGTRVKGNSMLSYDDVHEQILFDVVANSLNTIF